MSIFKTPLSQPETTEACEIDEAIGFSNHERVPIVVEELLKYWRTRDSYNHVSPLAIPTHEEIIEILHHARRILFPGYFTTIKLHTSNLEYYIGQETTDLHERLTEQIAMAIRHDCRRNHLACTNCEERSQQISLAFIEALPKITALTTTDIKATLTGDPATESPDEVIFCYPGLLAISTYRLAHELHQLGVPIIPRIMTEHAHSLTGIDIHPGATIGPAFFIDHGTGVVIGETTIIGKNVRIYQGVTLGALSLPADAGEQLRNVKRHPTIKDDVIIYANTTILGGDTVIGARSVIGGNIWLTESVEPDTKVLLKRPQLIYSNSKP